MLFTVIGILAVMSIFFLAINTLSRSQVQGANHFLDATRALGLAEAGAKWGVTVISHGGMDERNWERDYVPPDFYRKLFDDQANQSPRLSIKIPANLREQARAVDGTLEIWVELDGLRRLAPSGGFPADPRERVGKVKVEAIATINQISRKYAITKGIKTFLMVHPLLAKFTLFVRERHDDDDVNSIVHTTAGSYELALGGSSMVRPLEIFNSPAPLNVVQPRLDLGKIPDLAQCFESSGWIFLNSDAEKQPWNLNLSGATPDGVYDDRVLLRFGPYDKSRDFQGTLLNPARQPAPHQITALFEKFDGFKKDYTIFSGNGTIVSQRFLDVRYLFEDEGRAPKSSILRLFGTGTEFCPTMVFGPVNMRFVRFRAMNLRLSLMDQSRPGGPPQVIEFFEAGIPGYGEGRGGVAGKQRFKDVFRSPPGQPRDYGRDYEVYRDLFRIPRGDTFPSPGDEDRAFDNAWKDYEPVMTNIATAPFLDSLVYMKFLPEEGTASDPVPKEYDTSSDPFQQAAYLRNVPFLSGTITRDSVRLGKGIVFNRKRSRDGNVTTETAFEKPLVEADARAFLNKFTSVYGDFGRFKAENLKDGVLNVGGIIHTGGDGILIDEPVNVTSGGVLVTSGDIVINSRVSTADGEVLTLVTSRNIKIGTDQEVEAQLICLNGSFSGSGFKVFGGLATARMNLPGMIGDKTKQIRFNPEADPLAANMNLYRFRVSGDEEVTIGTAQ